MMRQIPLPLPHDAAMGVDDFLVRPSNQDAVSWVDAWPVWSASGLVVTGAEGSGKTHILTLWLAKTGGCLLTKEQLAGQPSEALTATTRCIAIDDADRFAGDAAAEESLFHLYNHLRTINGSLLLTMKQGVGQAGFVLPDLRSRLLTLPVAALGAPDDALLSALVVKQFRDRQVALDAGVVAYLAPRMARDAASIRAMVEKLDHAALAEGRKITIGLARRVLGGDA